MTFKKLALATAIAVVPAVGFSVETLDDSNLGDVTGQDGIRMVWTGTSVSMDVGIHDKDGLTGYNNAYSFDGGILLKGVQASFSGGITIDIDAGNNVISGAGSTLNVHVTLPATTSIVTGALYVGNSGRDEAAAASAWTISNLSGTIMDATTIVLGSTSLNIQLGNEPQGNMINLASTVTGGISLNNFSLNDANSGGGIKASSIAITDNGGSDLTLNVGVNVNNSGLLVNLGQVGNATTGMSIHIVDQKLGDNAALPIGDVSIDGLNINGTTLLISGK